MDTTASEHVFGNIGDDAGDYDSDSGSNISSSSSSDDSSVGLFGSLVGLGSGVGLGDREGLVEGIGDDSMHDADGVVSFQDWSGEGVGGEEVSFNTTI